MRPVGTYLHTDLPPGTHAARLLLQTNMNFLAERRERGRREGQRERAREGERKTGRENTKHHIACFLLNRKPLPNENYQTFQMASSLRNKSNLQMQVYVFLCLRGRIKDNKAQGTIQKSFVIKNYSNKT